MSDSPPAPAPKAFFKSKTMLANFIVAVAGVVAIWQPDFRAWVQTHPENILMGVGVLNMILRSVTHGKVALVDDTSGSGL